MVSFDERIEATRKRTSLLKEERKILQEKNRHCVAIGKRFCEMTVKGTVRMPGSFCVTFLLADEIGEFTVSLDPIRSLSTPRSALSGTPTWLEIFGEELW